MLVAGNNSLYYKSIGEHRKELKIGFYNATSQFGYGAGPFVAGILMNFVKFRYIFVTAAIIMIPFFILSLNLKDTIHEKFFIKEYKKAFERRETILILLAVLFFSFHYGIENVCFSLFLEKNILLTKQFIGHVYLIVGVVLITSTFITAYLFKRVKEKIIFMITGLILSGVSLISLMWCNNFLEIIVAKFFHVFGDAIFILFYSLAISNTIEDKKIGGPLAIEDKKIGGPLGLLFTLITAGSLIGSLIGGFFNDYLSPFVFSGILILLLSLFSVIISIKNKNQFFDFINSKEEMVLHEEKR